MNVMTEYAEIDFSNSAKVRLWVGACGPDGPDADTRDRIADIADRLAVSDFVLAYGDTPAPTVTSITYWGAATTIPAS